jgi:hypothetical protein
MPDGPRQGKAKPVILPLPLNDVRRTGVVPAQTRRILMRLTNVVLPLAAALAALVPMSSHADPYRWCAQYGLRGGGGTNCGFITLRQCEATVSGIGGFCVPNQFYTGPDRTTGSARYERRYRYER